jgi:hypothetical protein
MAVSWSWAWGKETAVNLEANMGWDFLDTSTAAGQYDSTTVYTYAGSPTRYSWAIDDHAFDKIMTLPTEAWVSAGWLCAPFYAAGTLNNEIIFEVKGGSSGNRIYVKHTTGGTGELYVDNTFKANFAGLTANNWHFLALQYDMSSDPWSGRVYLNGAAVTTAQTDARAAETAGSYSLYGFTNGTRATYWGGIIVYNSTGDAGQNPRFVTRILPNADAGTTVGTWTPSSGSDDFAMTNASGATGFDNATFTQETTPSSADQCVTEVSNVATQLGIVPPAIDGITGHTYSSGTGITVNAGVGSTTTFTAGGNVVPDSADTTYGFGTAPVDPTGGGAWSSGTTVRFRYKVV